MRARVCVSLSRRVSGRGTAVGTRERTWTRGEPYVPRTVRWLDGAQCIQFYRQASNI